MTGAAERQLQLPSVRAVGPGDLPIFRFDLRGAAVFYVPGLHPATVLSPSDGELLERVLAGSSVSAPDLVAAAARLTGVARDVVAHAFDQRRRRFVPECLTVLTTNACNLACAYCHSSAGSQPIKAVPVAAVRRGAELVASNCERQKLPLTTVFHGGGEPTLFIGLMQACLDAVEDVATRHGLSTFTYAATNGVMPEAVASAMGRRFDLVGISCDGPEDIQTSQRPARSGHRTSRVIERSASILRDEGCAVSVRATVTELGAERLAELVDYFVERFSPVRIVLEPMYLRGAALCGPLRSPCPDTFVRHLLKARSRAASKGIPLEFPDSCVEEIHGRFCHVLRDVLGVTPGGQVTACFDVAESTGQSASRFLIGSLVEADGVSALDWDGAEVLRLDLARIDGSCESCFNRFHCALGCPEACPLRADSSPAGSSRCRTALLWSYSRILEEAGIGVE